MRVKDNQPRLRDALVALCAERDPVDRHETADRGRHGRQEHRRVEVFEVEGRLDPDWRPWIACAARVTRLTWRKDTRTGLWARGEEVAEGDEIAAAQALIEELGLSGVLFTADALHCQKNLRHRGGDRQRAAGAGQGQPAALA